MRSPIFGAEKSYFRSINASTVNWGWILIVNRITTSANGEMDTRNYLHYYICKCTAYTEASSSILSRVKSSLESLRNIIFDA